MKEFIYDASLKKKNNFWCSSTFCIPCTKKVIKERNILTNNHFSGSSHKNIEMVKFKEEGKLINLSFHIIYSTETKKLPTHKYRNKKNKGKEGNLEIKGGESIKNID